MCFDMISKLVHIKTLLAPQELGPALLSHRTHGNRHPRLIGGTFEFLPDGCKAELIAVTCEVRLHCTYSINSCPSSGATKGQRTYGLIGSIHLRAEISFHAESFGRVPKFWLRILARKKCAKSFGAEFHAKIPCRNSEPKFWHCATTFGTKFWLEIYWHEILAQKTCRNFGHKRLFRHADV